MDEIGVSLPHNSPISTHQIQKRLWDLTPGVQFREIRGICVRPSELTVGFVWGVGIKIEWGWLQQPTSLKIKVC